MSARIATRTVPSTLPQRASLKGHAIFLSASFPVRDRSHEYYATADPDEITQAVVSLARATFAAGGRLVFGGHPSISPLVMMIAEEYVVADLQARREAEPLVVIYQCSAFREVVSPATARMAKLLLAQLVWTRVSTRERHAVNQTSDPRNFARSLTLMRKAMFRRDDLAGAVFIGGMEGLIEEAALFSALQPRRPRYFIGAPGGAANTLAQRELDGATNVMAEEENWLNDLANSREYPALMQSLVLSLRSKGRRRP